MIFKYIKIPATLFIVTVSTVLSGCGGGSSSSQQQSTTDIPITLSVENVELSAGVPGTFIYSIPAPAQAYTDVTIDLVRTLESVSISVTPSL